MAQEKMVVGVEGMACEHCVNAVKKAVGALDGVLSVEVSLKDKKAYVECESGKVKYDDIKNAIEDQGYDVV